MTFSVLMSVYAKEKESDLEECLLSLENQILKANEVILVEDGPISDELKSIIEKYRLTLNIVSVFLVENAGLAAALNEGLKHCSNEVVARMDADDIALPERFKIQVQFMKDNPGIAVSSGLVEEWSEDFSSKISSRVLPLTHDAIVKLAKSRAPISHPASIYRKTDVLKAGGYSVVYPEDYLLWIKMIQQNYKFANLPDRLLKMRTGNEFITRRGYKFLKGELKIYTYMYRTGFINIFEYLKITIIKSMLRLSPSFIKIFLYKIAR